MSLQASLQLESPIRVIGRRNYAPTRENHRVNVTGLAVTAKAKQPGFLKVLWAHRRIWITPLACEGVLFFAALHFSAVLAKAMTGGAEKHDWLFVAGAAVAYILGKLATETHELFMPRFVALIGVGTLVVMSIVVIGLLLAQGPAGISALGLKKRLIVAMPLGIFLSLEYLVIKGAHYAPRVSSLPRRQAENFCLITAIRNRVHYWTR
jgi:hypothetical protein